jgi:hypothetical protein
MAGTTAAMGRQHRGHGSNVAVGRQCPIVVEGCALDDRRGRGSRRFAMSFSPVTR